MVKLREVALQPPFEKQKGGAPRGGAARDDTAAVKTYRYLRLGMVVVVVALLASVLLQRQSAGCWQGSISAYYYSPSRPVFVSGMIAIAVSLIMIKGSTVIEDTLLNAAGMLAPIVAFVPTTYEAKCVPGQPLVGGGGSLPADIVSDVHNNIGALLIAGAVGLAIAVLVFVIEQRRGEPAATPYAWQQGVLLGMTGVVLLVAWWLLDRGTLLDFHGWAAVGMFGLLAIASIVNGAWLLWTNGAGGPTTSPRWKGLAVLYVAVGVVMIVVGVVIRFVWPDPWVHRTLVLEMVEIGLFAAIWIVQSVERWGKVLQVEPS